VTDERAGRSLPAALLAEARPKQWIKNLLVFAAPGAAGALGRRADLVPSIGAFVCFCLAASGTYYLNDAADVEADRHHPKKQHRPIAAGEIPLPLARAIGIGLILAGVGIAFAIEWHLGVVVAAYVTVTTLYSLWLKHQPIFDVVGVAAGFVLRAIAGGTAASVPISNWFFIVASFGSLFMVVGKRRAEATELGDEATATRRALSGYPPGFLVQLQTASASVVLVGYCLWAFEKAHLAATTMPWFQLSIVPFAMAIFRYGLLVDAGQGGAPEDVVLGDRTLQILGAAWFALFVVGVYA
jgi:decaprenyl-phosphate phosphoribosyltransferase